MNGDDFPTAETYACWVAAEAGDGQRDALRFGVKYGKYAVAVAALGDIPMTAEAYYAECQAAREARRADLLNQYGRG